MSLKQQFQTDTLNQMRTLAESLENDRCKAFPHVICNEVKDLPFDQWCEPCQARQVMKALRAADSAMALCGCSNAALRAAEGVPSGGVVGKEIRT